MIRLMITSRCSVVCLISAVLSLAWTHGFSRTAIAAAEFGDKPAVFYVAPQSVGDGSGAVEDDAADFRDESFWLRVRRVVQGRPVVVNFLDGTYLVSADPTKEMPPLVLSDLGHPDHQLILQGISKSGVVFSRHPEDSLEPSRGPGFLKIARSQNLAVRHLHFTGDHSIGYATHFNAARNVLIEGCSWIDLPGVVYGATGTSGSETDHITYKDCVFKRIGSGISAHMAYNAHGPQQIHYIDCQFEDCAGDYIRFRDNVDFSIIAGCTFKSTGTYRAHQAFITVPLFNDDDPAQQKRSPNYEFFGTHFLIFDNTFLYADSGEERARIALLFHHSGFDPPGRNHLLTPEGAHLLKTGTAAKKREFMLENLGIDGNSIHFFNNRSIGVATNVAYRSQSAYGAKSKGWNGIIDIGDIVNGSNVVETPDQALSFFD